MHTHRLSEVPDQVLIREVRRGSHGCYAELYRRHRSTAQALARSLCSRSQDADDVAAEAFTKVFRLLCRGQGPTSSFSSYLRQTVRSVAVDHYRSAGPVDLVDQSELAESEHERVDRPTDLSGMAQVVSALAALPPRWQRALWLTEVEECQPREVAESFGQNPHGFAAMTHRARWGLRLSYLEALLRSGAATACDELAAMAPSGGRHLSRAQVGAIEDHVAGCDRCRETDVVLCQAVDRIARLAA